MTHKHQPASVTQARQNRDTAWADYMALADELDYYAARHASPPAGFYERLEHARVAALKSDIEYGEIYRAAETLEARRRERAAEAEINTVEDEPAADFGDLQDEETPSDYEAMDRLAQTYPNLN